jgi:hypothetical protein
MVVPNGEGEHAAQTRYQSVNSPLAVSVQNRFRVGSASKPVTASHKLGAKVAEIVYLAVEGNADSAALKSHRLTARFAQIDDGKPSMAEDCSGPRFYATAVRPAPLKRIEHIPDCDHSAFAIKLSYQSRNSAHKNRSAIQNSLFGRIAPARRVQNLRVKLSCRKQIICAARAHLSYQLDVTRVESR